MDRLRLGDRYDTLDWLQAMAHGQRSLAEIFPGTDERFSPGIAQSLTLDWNVLMRRVNECYDDWGGAGPGLPLRRDADFVEFTLTLPRFPLGNLFIGMRSRHVADYLALYFLPRIMRWKRPVGERTCSNNLRRIALGMLLYQHEHGTLPPAYTVDAEGKPLQSWRVLLLPYVGEEKLFAQIRLDEPWDSEHNRQFHDAPSPSINAPAPDEAARRRTRWSSASDTAFRPAEGRSLDEFGMNLVLVVERCTPVCWMDPASELTEHHALGHQAAPKAGTGSDASIPAGF